MKKLVIGILFGLLPVLAISQSIFDKYENMDEVGVVVVNKGMIDLLSTIGENADDPEAKEFMDVVSGLSGLKVFITEDDQVSLDMHATVKKYLKSSKLEELMRVKDQATHVKFYVRQGKDENHVSEMLMFVTGIDKANMGPNGRNIETVLLTLTGDVDLRKIGSLTKSMDLPKELEKAEKK